MDSYNQLAPSVLVRSAFCERSFLNSVKFGCKQYLIYASGYDTSIYNMSNKLKSINTFEIDRKAMIIDKRKRLMNSGIDISKTNFISCDFSNNDWLNKIINSVYNKNEISFNSLLGISYYLTKQDFSNMIKNISNMICDGSSIIFDYQDSVSDVTSKNMKLANGAKEKMKSSYSYLEIEKMLTNNNFYIYEYYTYKSATEEFAFLYNMFNLCLIQIIKY